MKVVIFAWLNCKPKHLQKIASWWESKNIRPISVFSPPQNLFFPYWLGRRAGARTAKGLIHDSEYELGKDEKLFMHAFSGQASHHILDFCSYRLLANNILPHYIVSNPRPAQ